jgi:hypothetical protein
MPAMDRHVNCSHQTSTSSECRMPSKSSPPKMSHADLCEVAKKWLCRSNSQGGHGCGVALSECRSGWTGEMPDAIGFRSVDIGITETVLVEVKVSRADFLADAKKPHRAHGQGLGLFRYFMCPAGLIQPDEVPDKWGLLWVSPRGSVVAKSGPVAESRNCGNFRELAEPWKHPRDTDREMWLLVRVMARINDPDKMKKTLNDALREKNRLADLCNFQAHEIHELRHGKFKTGTGGASTAAVHATPRIPTQHTL